VREPWLTLTLTLTPATTTLCRDELEYKWDPEQKVWTFACSAYDVLVEALEEVRARVRACVRACECMEVVAVEGRGGCCLCRGKSREELDACVPVRSRAPCDAAIWPPTTKNQIRRK